MQALLNNEVLKASINTHFGEIEDPRAERTRAHYLVDIIVITLFAVIYALPTSPEVLYWQGFQVKFSRSYSHVIYLIEKVLTKE